VMGLQVKKKCCGKCSFGSNKIVSDARKANILIGCARKDTHFICHEATIEKKEVVCAAFYNTRTSQMIRISQRLGAIEFVD